MSNRRKPTRSVPLDGGPTRRPRLPHALRFIEWSDHPPAEYQPQTLNWIADQAPTRRRLNAWRCEKCEVPFIAFDRHPGTTPMMVSHHAFDPDADCTGMCKSVFYSRLGVGHAAVDLGQGGQVIAPSHEWYRPSAEELRESKAEVRVHVAQGGLMLRKAAA